MFRIDTAGNIDGAFSDGNPQEGQQATVVSADWLNTIQEELGNVIEHAGAALDKENRHQLRDAITTLIAGALGEGGGEEGAVPITREVNGTGLATGGGPLSANLAIDVAKASSAEIVTGTEDDKAITPLQLKNAAGAVFSAAGYIRMPGGLIIQWGTGTAVANGTTALTLPTTFPNLCLFAGVEGGSADSDASHNGPYVSGRGVSTINVFNALNTSTPVNFVALGY